MHHNLLFDLDQTLLDFHASEHIALKAVMEMNGQAFTEEHYNSFKHINKSLWLEFEKGHISKSQLFQTRFRLLFEECGCDTGNMDLLRINSDFIDHMSRNGVLMDGAIGCLKDILGSMPDARIYVITNGVTRNAMGRINSTGLNEYICDVFVSDLMGVSKPATEYFDIVKKAVGEPDESFIVIGDSLTSDMLGAKNAGLTSCWFMPEGDVSKAVKEYDIDYTASSFDELSGIIKKWSAITE
ncbi:MAG: noncanonical pyrimidine nucleotidase, YjjG family [Ruminococcus sp.]|nr:noncanonical pyrimidine nucleotidase, YjjG family [Ruminococcus sp.]